MRPERGLLRRFFPPNVSHHRVTERILAVDLCDLEIQEGLFDVPINNQNAAVSPCLRVSVVNKN